MSRKSASFVGRLRDVEQSLKPAGDAAVVDGTRHAPWYQTKLGLRDIQHHMSVVLYIYSTYNKLT